MTHPLVKRKESDTAYVDKNLEQGELSSITDGNGKCQTYFGKRFRRVLQS